MYGRSTVPASNFMCARGNLCAQFKNKIDAALWGQRCSWLSILFGFVTLGCEMIQA